MKQNTKAWTRRQFVQTSSSAALLAAMPMRLTPRNIVNAIQAGQRSDERIALAEGEVVRDLAFKAIEAAKAAGAQFAEARITRKVSESFMGAGLLLDSEQYGIGVRALVNGAWGFAASPYWDGDEAILLARDAVAQAKINSKIGKREVDMGSYPVAKGSWTTPIEIDPFKISLEEKVDFVVSFVGLFPKHVRGREIRGGMSTMGFGREERAIATTDGAYFTQTLFTGGGEFGVTVLEVTGDAPTGRSQTIPAKGIADAGAGWELMLSANLREQIPSLVAAADELMSLPVKPVEVGRYDTVCDADTMANLISNTLATATELDRAMGSEANAGGTSYLGPDPFAHLGTTALGTPLLNVSGERSMPRGLATVKWDNEGVEPHQFDLVKGGKLVDYQTTREQAAWLAPWYKNTGRSARSHGCASATSALEITQQRPPNLIMAAGTMNVGFDGLVANMKRGLVLQYGKAGMDFQSRNGWGNGFFREVVNGKLGAVVANAGLSFDSTSLWKNLQAIGGEKSREVFPAGTRKGQPVQTGSHSVAAVPGILKDLVIFDLKRKA